MRPSLVHININSIALLSPKGESEPCAMVTQSDRVRDWLVGRWRQRSGKSARVVAVIKHTYGEIPYQLSRHYESLMALSSTLAVL